MSDYYAFPTDAVPGPRATTIFICSHCKVPDTVIRGQLDKHKATCEFRKRIEAELAFAHSYEGKHAALLNRLPKTLRSAIGHMAYEQGHSAGNDEILCVLQNIVSDLEEPLRKLVEKIPAGHDEYTPS